MYLCVFERARACVRVFHKYIYYQTSLFAVLSWFLNKLLPTKEAYCQYGLNFEQFFDG